MGYGAYKRRSPKPKDETELSEHDEQVRVVVYLHKLGKLVYAIPNAGKRNPRLGKWLKDEGLAAGVPDLCIPMPSNGLPGLYIEMKTATRGSVSEYQEYWIGQLRQQGYRVEVCKGHDEAIAVINEYFGIVST